MKIRIPAALITASLSVLSSQTIHPNTARADVIPDPIAAPADAVADPSLTGQDAVEANSAEDAATADAAATDSTDGDATAATDPNAAAPEGDASATTEVAGDGEKVDANVETASLDPGAAGAGREGYTATAEAVPLDEGPAGTFSGNFYSILYGPSVGSPSRFQVDPSGKQNYERPLEARNFFALGYNVTDQVTIAPTFQWSMRTLQGQGAVMDDPFLRVSVNNVVKYGNFSLYVDGRLVPPVSKLSRENDVKMGVQSYQVATLDIPSSPLTFNVNTSIRYTAYGSHGFGEDLGLYFGPNVAYSLSSKVALTLLYEMGATHRYGGKVGSLENDGTDLEPGVFWIVSKNLNVNPYLNIQTGGAVSLKTTSLGATLNWTMF